MIDVATPASSAPTPAPRRRVPAAERRDAIIEAAVSEFAHGGLHGTPVDRIARRVGVAQPYVFSLFGSKRDLFLAAVERGFARVEETFREAVEAYRRGEALSLSVLPNGRASTTSAPSASTEAPTHSAGVRPFTNACGLV